MTPSQSVELEAAVERQELLDTFDTYLDDLMDYDWCTLDGARAILRALDEAEWVVIPKAALSASNARALAAEEDAACWRALMAHGLTEDGRKLFEDFARTTLASMKEKG